MSTRLGLVRCDHCQRQFNPHSAARHIPWCKRQQDESRKHRLSSDKLKALERYRWRVSYKPTNYPNQRAPFPSTNGGRHLNSPAQVRHLPRSSINSSVSSPSASSTTSLASLSNGAQQHQRRAYHSTTGRPAPQTSPAVTPGQLKRSISSVTLTKSSGGAEATLSATRLGGDGALGSASSKDSHSSAGRTASRQQRARTKSVSDLSEMSELVEVLAKRMEEIYLQNKQLLESIQRGTKEAKSCADERDCDKFGADDEFELCHHCRANCTLDANYCHKCGCKMRPSNPTPSELR